MTHKKKNVQYYLRPPFARRGLGVDYVFLIDPSRAFRSLHFSALARQSALPAAVLGGLLKGVSAAEDARRAPMSFSLL